MRDESQDYKAGYGIEPEPQQEVTQERLERAIARVESDDYKISVACVSAGEKQEAVDDAYSFARYIQECHEVMRETENTMEKWTKSRLNEIRNLQTENAHLQKALRLAASPGRYVPFWDGELYDKARLCAMDTQTGATFYLKISEHLVWIPFAPPITRTEFDDPPQ